MSEARFTTGSTMRHVAVMTATSSAGLLALFLVDALNLFYISRLGVTELAAAIGFAGTVQFFMISVSIGLLVAGSANVSRAVGAGERELARRLATSSLVTSVLVLSVAAALLWLWRDEALGLLGARGQALEQASAFLAVTLVSIPFLGIAMSCSGTLRAIGAARRAMYVTLGGGLIAAVLDPVFIFGLGLDLTGAAIAVVLTRAAMAGIGLWFVIRGHDMLARPRLSHWVADLRGLMAIAGPAMATQLSTPFGNAYLTNVVAEYGDGAVAGWAVIGRLSALAFGGIFALAGAVGPIVGQNFGAGLPVRIRSTYRDALVFVAVYVAVAWAVLRLGLGPIVEGFGLDADGAAVVGAFVTLGAGAFVFNGALFVSNAAFNNLGRPLWSTMFNWSRDALAIPVLALLIGPALGLPAAVWVQAIAAAVVGTVAAVVGWRTVTRIGARQVLGARVGPAAMPPFASGRAAAGIAVDEAPGRSGIGAPDPLDRRANGQRNGFDAEDHLYRAQRHRAYRRRGRGADGDGGRRHQQHSRHRRRLRRRLCLLDLPCLCRSGLGRAVAAEGGHGDRHAGLRLSARRGPLAPDLPAEGDAGARRSGRADAGEADLTRAPVRAPARPLVGVAASHHLAENTYEVQMTGRRTIDAVGQVAGCLPMLIPGLPGSVDVDDLLATVDGVVLTGARANVHPSHYGEELTEAHGLMDEGRDGVILPLVSAAIERGVPVLGLCKGIQEMNVALGGSLWPEVGALPGRHRHRMPKGCRDPKIVFEPRERVRLRPGGALARILGAESILTNSLHGQAVRELGAGRGRRGLGGGRDGRGNLGRGCPRLRHRRAVACRVRRRPRPGQRGALPRLWRRGPRPPGATASRLTSSPAGCVLVRAAC